MSRYGAEMVADRYLIRRFDPKKDLDAVYRCFVSGFHHNCWPLIDHAEPRVVGDSLLMTARAGDASFVAEADGEARGFLVGYFPLEGLKMPRAAMLSIGYSLKVLLRRFDMTAFSRAFYWRRALGQLAFIVRSPKSPSEILILCSQREYRGGIGRALMDAWVAEVRDRGYSRTTVCTDSTVSYDFYERYGFARVRDFPLKMYFHSMPGVDVRGYVYSLELDRGARP